MFITSFKSAVAMDDLSGQVVRGYWLRERIGKGAFGAVYRAEEVELKREVAVKIILPELASKPDYIQSFKIEAVTIAGLEHPYIVPLFQHWHDEKRAYLVMRYLRSGSLRKLLERGPLANDFILRIFDQIGQALAFAHQRGIIHRDLKPDNILLDEEGHAYLSDFGIAIAANSVENAPSGYVVGTFAYMSPEQAMGDTLTPQSDIYSLGVLLYELLTGKQPFADTEPRAILRRHVQEPLPSLRDLRPDLPPGLDDIIQRATAKTPSDRFPDAVSMAAALRQRLASDIVTRDLRARVYEQAELIPNQPLRLIGRDDLLAWIRQSLDEKKRVLLYGFGGIGKTALATTIAAERLKRGKGQVIWLEVGADSADVIFEAIGRGFGEGQMIASKSGQDRADAVRGLLEGKLALLVLDNVWNDQALFQVLKAIPQDLPVLMTSRHAIPLEGEMIDVGALPPDRALELLSYYSGRTFTESDDAKALCKRLGYHTFALEIAGKILKVERNLTPERLIARIADAPHNLRVPGSFADVGRESVKDLLDASVNELNERQRTVFTAMGGLFAPKASFKLLATLMGSKEGEVETLVSDLQQRGLAEVIYGTDDTPDHYRLHDLTHSYARALHRAANPTHRAVIAAVEQYVDEFVDDYDRLDFEQNNILEAARIAQEEGDSDALIHIMSKLNVEGNYFAARGHTPRSLELLKQAIEAAGLKRQIATAHYLWSRLGNTYTHYLGDLEKAFEAYKEAARLAVLMGDTRRQALLLGVIGTVRGRQAADDTDEYLQAAHRLAKAHNDDIALSQILEHMAYVAGEIKKDDHSARKFSLESLEVAERLNHDERRFFATLNLGAAEQKLKRFEAALSLGHRAFQIAESNGNLLWMAYALQSIGEARDALCDRNEAQKSFNRALELYHKSGSNVGMSAVITIMRNSNYLINDIYLEENR